MKAIHTVAVAMAMSMTAGCAIKPENKQGQAASVIEFLYPGTANPEPVAVASVAELKVPLRVGIAFVPDNSNPQFRITEAERVELLYTVRSAFQRYPFVSSIDIVPSSYLPPGGSFQSIDRVASMLSLDCIVLLSYDQMQFADATKWSLLYWTGIGAYLVPADRYDIMTSVEAAIFDVRTHKVLMRAGGTSQIHGQASWVDMAGKAREGRAQGYREAVANLVPHLHEEVKMFRERAPRDRAIRLDLPPGYDPRATKQ